MTLPALSLASFSWSSHILANRSIVYVTTFAGSGTNTTTDGVGTSASFKTARGIGVDSQGNVFVAETASHIIRKITPDGTVTTFAGSGSNATVDGTGTGASIQSPYGLIIDSEDNIYVASSVSVPIRKITSSGVVTTVTGTSSISGPFDVARDSQGNLYISSWGSANIYKVTPDGTKSVFAGSSSDGYADGTGTSAQFNDPHSLTIYNDIIYVADTVNHRIRKITPDGVVTTFAGSGTAGALDGQGTDATLFFPIAIRADSEGNLYTNDLSSNRIRKITPTGYVSTIAGNGSTTSVTGDGSIAQFNMDRGHVTPDSVGNLYVADSLNFRVKKVSFAPTITTTSSGSGKASGGQDITINGTGFVRNATVTIGGVTAGVKSIASNGKSLVAVIPSNVEGDADISVVNPDTGQSGTLLKGYKYDSTAPSLTVSAPTYSRDGTVVVNGLFGEDFTGLDRVLVKGSGDRPVVAGINSNKWEVIYSNVPNGTYQYSATVYDRAGNERQVVATNATVVDRDAPSLTVNVPDSTGQKGITISGIVAEGIAGLESFTINDTVVTINSGAFSFDVTLADGENVFTATAKDKAGNTSSKRVTVKRSQFAPDTTTITEVAVVAPSGETIQVPSGKILTILQAKRGRTKEEKAVIAALQQKLESQGLLVANSYTAGSFGASTTRAVRAFQVKYGLKPTGAIGTRTLSILDGNNTNDDAYLAPLVQNKPGFSLGELRDGAQHQLTQDVKPGGLTDETKFLQKKLYLLGYYNGPISGRMTSATRSALSQYRSSQSLGNGFIDEALRKSINSK